MGEHVGFDTAGGNGVDSDVLVAHVCAERSDESLDGVLAAGVQRVVLWSSGTSCDTAHQDNAAFHLEVLVCLLSDEELRSCVGVEHIVIDLRGDFKERGKILLAGVGHDDVETAKGFLAFFEELDDVGDLGDIGLDGNSIRAKRLDLLDNGIGFIGGFTVVDDNFGASLGKFNGYAFADTSAGTGDKGDLALEGGCFCHAIGGGVLAS